MKDHSLTGMDEFAALVARILIGGFFAVSGANNFLDLSSAIQSASDVGIPAAGLFVVIGAFFKFVVGILVIIKLQSKIAAMLLVIYIVVSSLLFYGPFSWGDIPQTKTIFLHNLAMLGGVLLLYAYSRGYKELAPHKPKHERTRRHRGSNSPT